VGEDDAMRFNIDAAFLARYKPVFHNYRKKAGSEAGSGKRCSRTGMDRFMSAIFYGKDGRGGTCLGEGNAGQV